MQRTAIASWASLHDVRADMKKAASELGSALTRLNRLPPNVLVPLAVKFREQSGDHPISLPQLLESLGRLRDLTNKVGHMGLPKKLADHTLKDTIGGLMLLLENATGERARVRPRRDGHEPELLPAAAVVIGKLLLSVDPKILTTTLVNAIISIRRAHKGKPLDTSYEHRMFIGGRVIPH